MTRCKTGYWIRQKRHAHDHARLTQCRRAAGPSAITCGWFENVAATVKTLCDLPQSAYRMPLGSALAGPPIR